MLGVELSRAPKEAYMSNKAGKEKVDDADVLHNHGPDMSSIACTFAGEGAKHFREAWDWRTYLVDEEYWKQFLLWPPWCLWMKAL
jgi:hypothetical protein